MSFEELLGLHTSPQNLTWLNMASRCVLVFIAAVIIGRLADRRSLGGNAAFDVMLGVILGSVLSRGINGQSAFFPTLAVAALLVLLHRALAICSYRYHWLSRLVKGQAHILIRKGECDHAALRAADITMDDLLENIRMNGNVASVSEVHEATFERNGKISVIKQAGMGSK